MSRTRRVSHEPGRQGHLEAGERPQDAAVGEALLADGARSKHDPTTGISSGG